MQADCPLFLDMFKGTWTRHTEGIRMDGRENEKNLMWYVTMDMSTDGQTLELLYTCLQTPYYYNVLILVLAPLQSSRHTEMPKSSSAFATDHVPIAYVASSSSSSHNHLKVAPEKENSGDIHLHKFNKLDYFHPSAYLRTF